MLAHGPPHLIAAHDGAQGVGAHPHVVLPHGVAAELTVESGDGGHLGAGQPQLLRAQGDSARGDEAVDALDQVQHRDQCTALVTRGVAGHDLVDLGVQVRTRLGVVAGGDRAGVLSGAHQRSTPPRTGSMEASEGTRSAIIPPSPIMASDCRLE